MAQLKKSVLEELQELEVGDSLIQGVWTVTRAPGNFIYQSGTAVAVVPINTMATMELNIEIE